MAEQKLFFDTDCLSAFLWVNQHAILPILYPGRIIIPEPVYIEISNPRIVHLKQRIDMLKNAGQVTIMPLRYGDAGYNLYSEMSSAPRNGKMVIGKGKASVIALAKEHNGIVASNNLRDIKQYINDFGLPFITTGDVLIEAYQKGLITIQQGDAIWKSMLAKQRKLGANSFSDYLNMHSPNSNLT